MLASLPDALGTGAAEEGSGVASDRIKADVLHPASRWVYVHHIFNVCLTMALARMQSKMKALMGQVEHFARLDDVWIDACRWTGPDVTRMWSTIWSRLDPFLRTNTLKKNGEISVEKSRQVQMAWRSCYNKLSKHLRGEERES